MLTYHQALETILDTVQTLTAVDLPIDSALDKVLAEPAAARWDLPIADNSAMDGVAFAWNNQQPGASFRLCGTVYAGDYRQEPIPTGDAVRIMTGAALPADCDTVVPIEDLEESGEMVRLTKPAKRGQHVRHRGEEVNSGETIVAAGTLLSAGDIGLLAAAGVEQVKVFPAPRVALLSTGNELVNLGESPGPGQIVNSNLHLLGARLRELGCEIIALGAARDDRDDLDRHIHKGLDADLLISTGGVSIGDRDHVQEVLARHDFRLGFWKVAIKPGKPVLFGSIGRMPVFGLPGNPAAAAATFELFVRPALGRLAGCRTPLQPTLRAELTADVHDAGKRQAFLWGELTESEPGRYRFAPSQHQGSNRNRAVQSASALLAVPAGSGGITAGSKVEVLVLRLPGRQRLI